MPGGRVGRTNEVTQYGAGSGVLRELRSGFSGAAGDHFGDGGDFGMSPSFFLASASRRASVA